jgi:hypothetical protein
MAPLRRSGVHQKRSSGKGSNMVEDRGSGNSQPGAGAGGTTLRQNAIDLAPIVELAQAFMASLSPDQTRIALLPLGSAAFHDWGYVPRERPGLPLGRMSEGQRAAAWALVASLLSERGLAQARGVLALEAILRERSGNGHLRDPGNYALAIFGDPSREGPWAWRLEGHHLSLTFTFVPGQGIALTPHFVGANPASGHVLPGQAEEHGPLLDRETGLAFELMRALDHAQLGAALIATESPRDIITGPGREASLQQPQGLALAGLSAPLRNRALALLEGYASRLRPELANRELGRARDAGLASLHLAWAGPVREGERHYYRLHGPTLLIEYDNTTGDHVHTVWHDPADPFGEDRLKRHRLQDHHDRT